MEGFDTRITSLYGSSSSPSFPRAVVSPCAACKMLRRRCDEKCMFAPYFPPSDPAMFAVAHGCSEPATSSSSYRFFVLGMGSLGILVTEICRSFFQELPESKRANAVSSMVYEAGMRIRDPVYGCAGIASQLQSQITHLELELANARAEIVKLRIENSNLMAFLYKQIPQMPRDQFMDDLVEEVYEFPDNIITLDVDNSSGSLWEPLWL